MSTNWRQLGIEVAYSSRELKAPGAAFRLNVGHEDGNLTGPWNRLLMTLRYSGNFSKFWARTIPKAVTNTKGRLITIFISVSRRSSASIDIDYCLLKK
jgi:hypothetical protein